MAVSGPRKVKTNWVIGLEKGAVLKVKVGSKVERGTMLAVTEKKNKRVVPMIFLVEKLGRKKLEERLKVEKGKKVVKTDLMLKMPGLLGKKVFWPISGKFVGLDEFDNFIFEEKEVELNEVLSPVTAVVEKADKDEIVLSFKAVEFRGKAMVEAKVWCQSDLKETKGVVDMDCSCENSLLFCRVLDEIFLTKAEVMSVSGVVAEERDEETEIESNLPILFLTKKDWRVLIKMMSGEEGQMLLNTRLGRLLIVV